MAGQVDQLAPQACLYQFNLCFSLGPGDLNSHVPTHGITFSAPKSHIFNPKPFRNRKISIENTRPYISMARARGKFLLVTNSWGGPCRDAFVLGRTSVASWGSEPVHTQSSHQQGQALRPELGFMRHALTPLKYVLSKSSFNAQFSRDGFNPSC